MRPLGFLTGVVLGSAASVALVLLMVVLVFALSRGGEAVRAEFPGLLAAAGLFAVLAAAAASAFVGLQRRRPWRWTAQAAMWLTLAAIAFYYWPAGSAPGE
jgi:hypothetical protein